MTSAELPIFRFDGVFVDLTWMLEAVIAPNVIPVGVSMSVQS
jgi:hypothetical protein